MGRAGRRSRLRGARGTLGAGGKFQVPAGPVLLAAESGRGRQLRIQQTFRGDMVGPSIAEVQPAQGSDPGAPSSATGKTQRNSALIYHDARSTQKQDSGEYHMTKGDKRAGWILLGVLVVEVLATIANGDF